MRRRGRDTAQSILQVGGVGRTCRNLQGKAQVQASACAEASSVVRIRVLVQICVRSLDKERSFVIPSGCEVVTDYDGECCCDLWGYARIADRESPCPCCLLFLFVYCSAILNDDSINCIVEVMGGVTDAKDVVFQAIQVSIAGMLF